MEISIALCVVHGAGAVPPLAGCLLSFLQVSLRFVGVCLEFGTGLLRLRLGLPGSSLFLELPRLRDDTVGNVDNLTFSDWFTRRGCVVNVVVQPHVETLEGRVGIVGLPQILVFFDQLRGQYPCEVIV